MNKYDHIEIEGKWQKIWEETQPNKVVEDKSKNKFYALIEFPFPSGDGLHVGHIRSNTAMDIISRKRRSEGYNVLYPIGWDAFGLPTENYAIKTGIAPSIVSKNNSDTFRRQLKSLGFSFDWSREIDTTDPKYYKWTQWIFLQFLKKGLAYKKKMSVNWCPKDLTGLANEEVVDGCCERCGTKVEKREKEQWMLAITKYADRLDKDLDDTNFLEKIKIQQRNWIGRSEGAEINFKIKINKTGESIDIPVYTTRPDTIFGVTYLVLAPEHPFISNILNNNQGEIINNSSQVAEYIKSTKDKTEIERVAEDREKTGVEIGGIKAVNPANGEEVSVWIADYVLAEYGTGAVMAVPAHDERDMKFAKTYDLPVKEIELQDKKQMTEKYGKAITKFKLRDWIFSRQRYWGEPIPVVHCAKCGIVPLPESELPLLLPEVKNYKPTDNGESPLSAITEWVNTKCPNCHGDAKRETDTMPNWAGSSWYYLRYMDAHNDIALASKENLEYWNQVDWYNGGMEHTTLHLLYSRFWHKFLFDLGIVPTNEPYKKRTSHGLILAEGGEKMSKSKGNVINPDTIVKNVGADTLRIHEMFMGPFDQPIAWDTNSIVGSRRFIERVWKLFEKVNLNSTADSSSQSDANNGKINSLIHKTIKKVSDDIEEMKFNTAISSMMMLLNELEAQTGIKKENYEVLIKILAPFAPHVTEELWAMLGNKNSIHIAPWPKYEESMLTESVRSIAVQVNGKVRASIEVDVNASDDMVKEMALNMSEIKKWTDGQNIKKVIVIKNKVVSIVI